ncbi:unnamed protein product [Cuscuta campestris]|uniref:DUF7792 domain-containing protein n=1 Tax=Cuscuta campestris TaxID=132261 RepID=A0A484LGE7_9ASTE|nr:unnamed protein product [Cuscuta campestris]
MADLVKQILAKPIQLADMVIKAADEACSSKQDCGEIKSKTEKLAALLRQAARASNDLYERPTRRILDEIEQVLEKALALVLKCRSHSIVKRVFFINLAAAFRKMHSQLENSVGNVSWLLRVSASASADECLGLPPIAANEPILCLIWEQIATLHTGPPDDASASDAAASLVSLARDNDRYGKLIIEEGGVGPLLKLLKEGKPEGQENAARAIGLLGRDPESVEQIIVAGASSVFTKVLKEGPMKVQAVVLASNKTANKNSTNLHNVVETTVAMKSQNHHHHHHHHYQNSLSIKSREFEDPETKSFLKSMSARALCRLAKNNHSICRSITESRALLCFAVLLEKGPEDVQYNSAMAVMEITAVAEQDPDLRRSAFKPNSPSCKAIVDQLVRIIENPNSNLLIPCIVSVGNLARTFRATETRVISPLVKLLDDDEREADVAREVVVALTKFASKDNYLHMYHSKEIIGCGGANHLVQLVYLGESEVQSSALVLLCHIAMNVPDCEELARAEVLTVLEWASKQANIAAAAADDKAETLLHDAKSKLELYQSRGLRGFR